MIVAQPAVKSLNTEYDGVNVLKQPTEYVLNISPVNDLQQYEL